MSDYTTDPVDWDSPTWGHNPVHISSAGAMDAEGGEDW